jgi:putative ABC transport system ATP-binding protein
MTSNTTLATPLVRLTDVEFSWQANAKPSIHSGQLTINQQEHVFIQGASGSGKSTLLNIIGGIVTPRKGHVEVLGHDLLRLKKIPRDRVRADHIGFIFQQFNLIPYLSIIENVILPCRFSKVRERNAIQRSGTVREEALYLLNRLYSTSTPDFNKPARELSVGQQQRIAAARALIGQPQLIIADEPTSSLDYDAREAFLDLLFDEVRASGSTLLYVSHDPSHKHLFDRVIDMSSINSLSS